MAHPHASHAAIALTFALLVGGLAVVLVTPPAKAGTAIVFQEDFESGTLGARWNTTDTNPASGLDYWGVTNYRSHAGNYSAWCAQVGNQSSGAFLGENNSAAHEYDDNMQADLGIDLHVNGFTSLTLSFYYWSKAESGGGDWIQAWYEANGTQTPIFTTTGTARWDLASVAVPNDVERLIIRWHSDAANHAFEGGYVDDVILTGVENNPPASNVLPLPVVTNAVPFQVPYTSADGANESGIAYVELWYRHGTTGNFTKYVRPSNPLGLWYPWASATIPFDRAFAQGDGYYEFYTVARDNASNEELPPPAADASTTIDTSPPSIAVTAPAAGAWFGTATVTVDWQASDAISGVDRYETSLDGGAFASSGTATTVSFASLADGGHSVAVRAFDVAGNSATATASFSVDTAGPTVSITAPSVNDLFSDDNVTFGWTAQDAGSGVDHFEIWLDDGGHTNTTQPSATISLIPNGQHTFHVIAYDRVGNTGETSVRFGVDVPVPYTPLPSWLWILLLIVIVVSVLLFLLWWKRRKDEEKTGVPRKELTLRGQDDEGAAVAEETPAAPSGTDGESQPEPPEPGP